jgi:hypothetical protein
MEEKINIGSRMRSSTRGKKKKRRFHIIHGRQQQLLPAQIR